MKLEFINIILNALIAENNFNKNNIPYNEINNIGESKEV